MSKKSSVKEKQYIVTRIFEPSKNSILDVMLEHYAECWEKELNTILIEEPEDIKKASKITL